MIKLSLTLHSARQTMRAVALLEHEQAGAINRDQIVMTQQALVVPNALADQRFDGATHDLLHFRDLDAFAPFIQAVSVRTLSHSKQFQKLRGGGRVVAQLFSDLAAC